MSSWFRMGSSSTSSKAEDAPAVEPAMAGLEVTKDADDEGEPGAQASDADRQSLWKVLSSKLGGDVSVGISLPVSFFEPTSTLQRMAEMLHFSEFLDGAADAKSPLDKLALIAVFAVSNYNSTERFYKPFNPILGETFEFVDEAKGVHLVGEQVAHHPPISAAHCEGKHWVFWQETRPTTKFNGNSIDIYTNSKTHIYIPRTRDHFVFKQVPVTRVNNLIIGRSWMEHFGPFLIENLKTGDSANIQFEKSSWAPWRSSKHAIHGDICNKEGKVMLKIRGRWSEELYVDWVGTFDNQADKAGTSKRMWKRPEVNAIGKYRFTEFTHRLNEMHTDEPALESVSYEELLPRTDGRLRPDRLALEQGDTNKASKAKNLIEEKQRSNRKARAASGVKWQPKWFHCVADIDGAGGRVDRGSKSGSKRKKKAAAAAAAVADDDEHSESDHDSMWVYCGDYWEQREQRLQWLNDRASTQPQSDDGSSEVARDTPSDDHEPLGALDLVGTACDFRGY